jgi:HemY protein
MRGVIWLVLLFVVAVVAATTLGSNDGLVSIFWGGWRTDLSLNLFIVVVLAGCVLGVAAAHAVGRVVSLPRRAGEWRALRRERAAQAALREALAEFYSARYGRARTAARKALALQGHVAPLGSDAQFRTLAHLLAAASLHRLQDRSGRNDELNAALQAARRLGLPGRGEQSVEDGARLLGAEWALDDRDPGRAIETLAALSAGAARRTQALRLRLQAARLARAPAEALRTARLLAHHQAFSPVVAQSLLRSLAGEVLDEAHDPQQLRQRWHQFDQAERSDALTAARAATRAVQLGTPDVARQWLRPFWDRAHTLDAAERAALALALVEARQGIGSDWLPALEAAAQTHGQDSAVLAAVGLAFAQCGLWGKARRLLERADAEEGLPPRTRRIVLRELAQLARREGDEVRAGACERAAAAID